MTNRAFPIFTLPDPEIRGTGTFTAPALSDSERAVIHARALELENSADPIHHQAGIDNCRLLAEIDRLWSLLIERGTTPAPADPAGMGCGIIDT